MASERRDTRKRTRGPELDPNNPNNWTSTELKDKLASLGIKISENFTNKQLKHEQISSVSTRGRESSNSLSNPRRDYLDFAVENLQAFVVADSTKALYNVGYEHYLKFLQLQGSTWSTFQLPPVSENLLMRFIAFCETHKHLRYSIIKSYLCGIRFFYLLKGGVNPFENFVGKPLPKLKSVLVAIQEESSGYPSQIILSGSRYTELICSDRSKLYVFQSTEPYDPRNFQILLRPLSEEKLGIQESVNCYGKSVIYNIGGTLSINSKVLEASEETVCSSSISKCINMALNKQTSYLHKIYNLPADRKVCYNNAAINNIGSTLLTNRIVEAIEDSAGTSNSDIHSKK
ncbi:unnamed protein product [Mytilus coruscus]|uniref:Uncharacterized protein n=1 Tax=Mytilus coruscus TaxID=42192 RepID=A0A6J8DDC9_MYTCO|nr:unnamed protein product [Mytilus coruscus]